MPGQSDSSPAAPMFTRTFAKHLVPALLAGLALRLFFILHFPFYSGDTAYYEELARNWLYHGIYGFYSHGQLVASDARGPGYPAFLAAIYFLAGTGRKAVMLAQAFVDLATCVLAAGVASRLAEGAPDATRSRVATAALWLTALCPFTANYAAVPLTEVLATFFTTLALLVFLSQSGMEVDRISSNRDLGRATKIWFAGGLVVGLGALVRPETPLLLVAVLIFLWLRYRRPANWKKLALATLWMIVGVLLPLAPWAARNAVRLGRVQFLAPRYAETYGDVLPTGFYAWTKTWMFRFRDAYLFTWKLPSQPIDAKNLPSYAVDSPEELARVASLFDRYNRVHGMTRQLDFEFAELARERAKRHPIRTYFWIPIERAASMWFTPRITLLPFSGRFWPLAESYHYNPAEFEVTLGLTLLNVLYFLMFLVAAWFCRANPGVLLITAFILIRTAFLTQLQTCEPRYVLVCFPALLAVAAQLWQSSKTKETYREIVIP
jgi:glycosyl transferase family 22 (putative mannosyltransferase)